VKVSVVITTYNRAGHLNRGLYTLLNQDYKPDEVIIVDDGSQDYTADLVKTFQNEYPNHNIKYIYNNNPGYTNCCLAKNIGIKQAKGELIIFTEPEVLHIGNTIKQHVDWHEKELKLFVSAGTVYFVFAGIIRILSLKHFRNPELITKMKEVIEWREGYIPQYEDIAVSRRVSACYCASARKEWLVAIGGFDERFLPHWGWDDIDLQSRLSRFGVNCISDENIKVVHLAHGYTGCFEKWNYNKTLHDDPNKPIVANKGKEWGVIRT